MNDHTSMIQDLPAIGDYPADSTTTLLHPTPGGGCPATAGLVQASISASTRRAYRGTLERLDIWLDGRVLDDYTLAEWITNLHGKGLSASAASLAVAAARFRARMAGKENPAGPVTLRTLAGIRRSSRDRGRGQVAGVPWEEADRVVDEILREGTLRGMRDAALIAVGSDALLRVSEMVAIDADDIERHPDGSAVLHILRSKTDQEGAGATCYLGPRTVEVLDAWVASAGIGQYGDQAVFRSVRKGGTVGSRLSARSARSIVIARCGGGNGNGKGRISGHSLRVGSAISLARAGASLVELQQAGRWKSPEMPARYTRGESARRGAIARLRHGQAGEIQRKSNGCTGTGGITGESLANMGLDTGENPRPDIRLVPGNRINRANEMNTKKNPEAHILRMGKSIRAVLAAVFLSLALTACGGGGGDGSGNVSNETPPMDNTGMVSATGLNSEDYAARTNEELQEPTDRISTALENMELERAEADSLNSFIAAR